MTTTFLETCKTTLSQWIGERVFDDAFIDQTVIFFEEKMTELVRMSFLAGKEEVSQNHFVSTEYMELSLLMNKWLLFLYQREHDPDSREEDNHFVMWRDRKREDIERNGDFSLTDDYFQEEEKEEQESWSDDEETI